MVVRIPPPCRLKVLDPCFEDFHKMDGDNRKRFCKRCQKHVHHVSDMTRKEAEAFVNASRPGEVCVRYCVDEDGEIQFRPPSTVWRLGFVAALSLAMAACTGYLEERGPRAPGCRRRFA